jgi:glycosyltransferase involved in cell wall biosynthesis
MNVIYLTTAMRDEDFRLLSHLAAKKPNPAGQNFHNKLIRAISLKDQIQVYSIVPSYEHIVYEGNFEGKSVIDFFYFEAPKNRFKRYFNLAKTIAKTIEERFDPTTQKDAVIMYDSLNIYLAKASAILSHRLGIKRVAILTDNPDNITGVSHAYVKKVLKLSKGADGFFSLSNSLIDLFNPHQRNFAITEGVVESNPRSFPLYNKPYIYFGGALYIKYGVPALIAAYQLEHPDYDLLIAGHGPYEAEIRAAAFMNPRIIFLGQVGRAENYNYERHAALNINPRRFNEDLDRNSIPSKMLEYLAAGQPILSTRQSRLQTLFPEDVNWIDTGDNMIGIKRFFHDHLNDKKKFINLKTNGAEQTVLTRYGLEATSKTIHNLLTRVLHN